MWLSPTALDTLFHVPFRRLPRLRGRLYHRLAPRTFPGGMRIGRGVRFERPSRMHFDAGVIIADGCVLIARSDPGVPDATVLRVGAKTFFNSGCVVAAETNSVDIGVDVLFGPHAVVVTGRHRFADAATPIARQGMDDSGPVRIGDGSWIAAGAVILGGTTIAAGSVVAANAVVRGHFPRRALLAGAPARAVRCLDENDGDDARVPADRG